MILKDTDAKSVHLVELASLLSKPGVPADKQALIERELKFMRAGMKGESESAYDIDFYSGPSKNRIVIHDLRLEHNGRVAQIDHLKRQEATSLYVVPRGLIASPTPSPIYKSKIRTFAYENQKHN